MELHQKVKHVYDVEQDLQNQRITLDAAVVLQELDAFLNDRTVRLVRLQELIVVRLLDDQEDDLHEVEEAQVLVGLLVGQENEFHDVLDVVLVSDFLDVLKVCEDLH